MAKSFNARMGARFTKITSDYGKINAYVHDTAMMILRHAQEHKDCSTAQGLINAMPQSARKLALINWFHKYSPIVVKDDSKWASRMHKPDTKLYVPFDIEAAEANPWYNIADEMGAEKVYHLDDMLKIGPAADAKRIRGKLAKGEVAAEDIAAVTAYAEYLESIKVPTSFTGKPANDGAPKAKPAKAA